MGLLGGKYIWVKEEDMDYPVETSLHPVETGAEITSHVKQGAASLALSGYINEEHNPGGVQATVVFFKEMMRGGFALAYIGRNILTNCHIVQFSTGASNNPANGVAFDMTLRELRIARNNFTDGAGYNGDLIITAMNYEGTMMLQALSEVRERFHQLQPGDTLYYVAEQFATKGVTADGLREMNRGRPIFAAGHQGDYAYMQAGAEILLGVW